MAFVKLKRFREIGFIFVKYGLSWLIPSTLRSAFGINPDDSDERFKNHSIEERIRMAFEELGTTYIKLGQMLSSRNDIIPQSMVDEFKKLQDEVKPIPFEQIKPLIEEALGGSIEQFFLDFDVNPIGTASISQVYQAVLKEENKSVVIKVRKPAIVENINGDMEIILWACDIMNRHSSAAKNIDFRAIAEEFFNTMKKEMNFLTEKNNIIKFRENFDSNEWHFISFPNVYENYCNDSIIIMDKITGKKLGEILEEPNEIRIDLARKGINVFMKMILDDGFFHADLHSGNLFFTGNGNIAIIDCGMVGKINQQTRNLIAKLFVAFAAKDARGIATICLEIAENGEKADKKAVAADVKKILETIPEKLEELNLGTLINKISGVLYKHKLEVPSYLTMLFRGISMLEGMGRTLVPNFDIISEMTSFARKYAVRYYTPEKIMEMALSTASTLIDTAKSLPENLSDLIEKIEKGKLQHNLVFTFDKRERKFISKLVTRVTSAFILTGSMLAFKKFDNTPFSIFLYTVALISIVLFFSSFKGEKDEEL